MNSDDETAPYKMSQDWFLGSEVKKSHSNEGLRVKDGNLLK